MNLGGGCIEEGRLREVVVVGDVAEIDMRNVQSVLPSIPASHWLHRVWLLIGR